MRSWRDDPAVDLTFDVNAVGGAATIFCASDGLHASAPAATPEHVGRYASTFGGPLVVLRCPPCSESRFESSKSPTARFFDLAVSLRSDSRVDRGRALRP